MFNLVGQNCYVLSARLGAHGATLSRARVIFPTPRSVSSPEAISDAGWTQLIGVTDQEVVSVVLRCSVF